MQVKRCINGDKKNKKIKKSSGLKVKNRLYYFKYLLQLSISNTFFSSKVGVHDNWDKSREKKMMRVIEEKHHSTKFYPLSVLKETNIQF
jgi:hypothetical protein